jgi:hypothetical protein
MNSERALRSQNRVLLGIKRCHESTAARANTQTRKIVNYARVRDTQLQQAEIVESGEDCS